MGSLMDKILSQIIIHFISNQSIAYLDNIQLKSIVE